MAKLADHWSEGDFIPEGQHVVTLIGVRFFEFNSGGPGVELTVQDAHKRKLKIGFSRKSTALWKIAQFMGALGLTREAARAFDTDNQAHYQRMCGKSCVIEVEKNEKGYSEATAYYPLDSAPAPTSSTRPAPAMAGSPASDRTPSVDEIPPDMDYEGIPF